MKTTAKKKASEKASKVPQKVGRPTKYTVQTAEKICALIASGKTLNKICSVGGMPKIRTIMTWLWDGSHEEFRQMYARAREQQAEVMADEIITIADDDSLDEIFTEDGKRLENREFINRSRLRIDSRKWVASKLLPKKYGDKTEVSGPNGGPVPVDVTVTFVRPGKPGCAGK